MVGTFKESKLNSPIGSWNVSNVTNMNEMFRDATLFNQSIAGWNVSNVTNMSYMFYGATAFNEDISNWNTVSLTNMDYMLYNAGRMLTNVGGWNYTNVTSMNNVYNYTGAGQYININIMGGTLFLMSLARNPTILNKTFSVNMGIRFIGTPRVLALYNDLINKRPNFNFFGNDGVNISVLKTYNYSARQYNIIGVSLSDLLSLSFGYALIDLSNSGFQKIDYANNIYSLDINDLYKAGFSLQNLADAGYSFAEIKGLGFPLSGFVSTNFVKSDYSGMSYTVSQLY